MSPHKKTWILVRGCQYQPGGAISLGQLLLKPFEPSLPLLPEGPLPVDPKRIERTYQTDAEIGTHNSLGVSFQLWTTIDVLPIQADLKAEKQYSNSVIWNFDRIDSEIFIPRLQDIQDAVNREEVLTQIHRKKFDFRKRLYMITGVRVARGARLNQQFSKTYGGGARVGVDLAAFAAAPVTVGPSGDISNTVAENYSFKSSSDFVYAYRVCEVHYGKDVHVRPYSKGETFGIDENEDDIDDTDDTDDAKDVGQKQMRMLVEKVADTDYDGAGVAHQLRQLDPECGDEDEFIFTESP